MIDDVAWQRDRVEAFTQSLRHLYEENERLRRLAKRAILLLIGVTTILGAVIWRLIFH